MKDFELWINNPYLLNKNPHPSLYTEDKQQIEKWEKNPYEHPYTRGAYDAWTECHKTKAP